MYLTHVWLIVRVGAGIQCNYASFGKLAREWVAPKLWNKRTQKVFL